MVGFPLWRSVGVVGLILLFSSGLEAHNNPRPSRWITIKSDQGIAARGIFAEAETTPAPAVLVVPDRDGLSGATQWIVAELGRQGYIALGADLYQGEVATTPKEADSLFNGLQLVEVQDRLTSWLGWLKAHFSGTGDVALLSWGDGCQLALKAAAAESVTAVVCYYPKMPQGVDLSLAQDTLFHLSREQSDQPFKNLQNLHVETYNAAHGFANFTEPSFDQKADSKAWQSTLSYLASHLKAN